MLPGAPLWRILWKSYGVPRMLPRAPSGRAAPPADGAGGGGGGGGWWVVGGGWVGGWVGGLRVVVVVEVVVMEVFDLCV